MFGWIFGAAAGVGALFTGLYYVAGWGGKSTTSGGKVTNVTKTTDTGATAMGGAMTCEQAQAKVPLALQKVIVDTMLAGDPAAIDTLANQIDDGVKDGMIDSQVGATLSKCLRSSKAVAKSPFDAAPVKDLSAPLAGALKSNPLVNLKEAASWPFSRQLHEPWKTQALNAVRGIDYYKVMKNQATSTPFIDSAGLYKVASDIFKTDNQDDGLGGVLQMAVDELTHAADMLRASEG